MPCKELPMNPAQREILVIDGDEGARALIGQTLAEQGFAVTAVGDGSAALHRIEAKPFALVVAEIRLPGPLDGLTTIRQARARRPGLKCLFTSGFEPAALWNNVELEDFIAKPFHRRDLVGCVFELLQREAAAGGVVAADLGCRHA
jgi:DNA-binding response OmpR family regulator